ncbi:cysteine hydrolase [Rhizobium sp. NFR12]|uniref:cysteine hydrolase family protein n=1 Tax=Rhizobium sp. NFR12 TaxID=1566261 RepID=UPI0008A80E3F|nr:cysteine hydrolase [Rhizobium sp. NFR12]SEH30454.1 Nicotinamidase-related amidase [Rhizobium sp. NFR12]
MSGQSIPIEKTGLIIVDLTNDFLAPDGAYGRAGQGAPEIAALSERIKPLVDVMRAKGGYIISAQFTLVPGKGGEPIISPHLKELRPFLGKGDFAPGTWGNSLIDDLAPADLIVEKVAYSAFYMTRLEWVLRKCGIEKLVIGGIVTNGGVASTVRDAHVRDFETITLSDGSAAFSQETHETAIAALKPVSRIATIADMIAEFEAR